MAERPITCFVSYAHRGMDRDSLDAVVELMREGTTEQLMLLIDEDQDYGTDLNKFMALLESVDAALVIMTPEYKTQIQERRGGVYQEYSAICARYRRAEAALTETSAHNIAEAQETFEILPVLFSGTRQDSVPDEISHLKYLDLVDFRGRRSKDASSAVTSDMRTRYAQKIRRLTRKLEAIVTPRMHRYRRDFKENFDRLFINLKADWTQLTDEAIFVKTSTYNKVAGQEVYFLVGRKGSGKSTIADYLPWQGQTSYKGHIGIRSDDLDLERSYAFLSSARFRSDLSSVFSGVRSFQMAWEMFIYLCCIQVVIVADDRDELTAHQKRYVRPLRALFDDIGGQPMVQNERLRLAVLFTYAWNSLSHYMDQCIAGARDDDRFFFTDVVNAFSLERFLERNIGREPLFAFNEIISTCRRRILITLDGFDTQFNEFRKASLHLPSDLRRVRTQFELDWLRSLLAVVLRMKENRRGVAPLYRLLDFCMPIPRDRFEEIRMFERDAFTYRARFASLSWSGIELTILIRKRLEVMSRFRTSGGKPEDRLQQVLQAAHPHIPWLIGFTSREQYFELPLFLYILRNTFWRPREVLMHYAGIIALADDMRRRELRLSAESIEWSVKRTNREIVQTEIINEFSSMITNIESVIHAFERCRQVLDYADVEDKLRTCHFEVAWGADVIEDLPTKVEFLYEIGLLGVRATTEQRATMKLRHRDAFSFNEGRVPFQMVAADRFTQYQYVLHPVLCNYLALDSNDHEMVLRYTWEYLKEMETLLHSGIGFEASF